MKELIAIQSGLKAPKSQFNKFGGYKYRKAEDILEAVKPLLNKQKCTLTITDDIVMVGNRIYVKATATIKNEKGECETTTGWAREEETKRVWMAVRLLEHHPLTLESMLSTVSLPLMIMLILIPPTMGSIRKRSSRHRLSIQPLRQHKPYSSQQHTSITQMT